MKKKEFAKVQKRINDQMNKYADKIIVGQYTGQPEPQRQEGDFWKDRDGKQWTVKKGIKQSISPLQDAKTPWWCPVCGKSMTKLDVKTFRATSQCYDCVAEEESKLKMDGLWDTHKEKKIFRPFQKLSKSLLILKTLKKYLKFMISKISTCSQY